MYHAFPGNETLLEEDLEYAPLAEVWRVFSTREGFTRLGVAKAEMDFLPLRGLLQMRLLR